MWHLFCAGAATAVLHNLLCERKGGRKDGTIAAHKHAAVQPAMFFSAAQLCKKQHGRTFGCPVTVYEMPHCLLYFIHIKKHLAFRMWLLMFAKHLEPKI